MDAKCILHKAHQQEKKRCLRGLAREDGGGVVRTTDVMGPGDPLSPALCFVEPRSLGLKLTAVWPGFLLDVLYKQSS